jgi:RNA polymerase-binding transcription factor DksA
MSEHVSPLDLDAIERDLADVDAALTRLDNDTYWVDEVTGQPLGADLLASQPTARRNNP